MLIEELQEGIAEKVVFSRIESQDIKKSPIEIFNQLNDTYKKTFNYLISIENEGCWVGATPELFIESQGEQLKTVALAGTKLASREWTEKERIEQAMVSDFIDNVLKKYTNKITINGPKTVDAGPVQHLKTEFECQVSPQVLTQIINELHPTPATCGLPKEKALHIIQTMESHQRRFYTGFLGIVSPNEMKLFVNLRCMEIIESKAYLYLGGGITAQSVAEDEWDETLNKAKTLKAVLD